MIHPQGWTCYRDKFNLDLLSFLPQDINDCELLEILIAMESMGYNDTSVWDDVCK